MCLVCEVDNEISFFILFFVQIVFWFYGPFSITVKFYRFCSKKTAMLC